MDNLTPEQRRKNMSRIRSSGTLPEKLIARELRRRKIYFVANVRTITGKPDFVFRRKKIAVFVDSDFWHVHPERFIMPKSNIEYWKTKIERNQKRDTEVTRTLSEQGWKVIRLWEHDVKKNLEAAINQILRELSSSTLP